jgi:hypothetical protein
MALSERTEPDLLETGSETEERKSVQQVKQELFEVLRIVEADQAASEPEIGVEREKTWTTPVE